MIVRKCVASAILRVLLAVCAVSVVVSTAPQVASAQDADPKKILELIGSANDKFEKEDFQGALEDYEAAFAMYPDPSLLYRMGLSSEKLNRQVDAIDYYEKFIDAVPDDKTAKKVKDRLAELRQTAPARIKVETTPPGAQVHIGSLDNPPIGETPGQFDIPAGDVSIYVALEGYDTELRNLKLENAQRETLSFEMSEEAKLVDVDPNGETGGESSSSTLSTWGWVLTGTGVALIGGGIVFGILSQSKTDEVNDYDKRAAGSSPGELQELKDSANSFYSTSLAFYVAGGVVAATGITFLIIDGMGSESQASMKLDFSPTHGGAHVGLSGSF